MTQARKTPNTLWIAAGLMVITAVLAALGLTQGWFGSRGASSALLAQPAYRILERHEPAAWRRVLAAYERSEAEAGRARFIEVANAEFSAAATRRLARAAPDAQLALMRDMVANLERLRTRPGDACFKYLYPEIAGSSGLAEALPAEAQARTLALSAEVIRTAAESPTPPPPPDEAARKLGPVVDAVYAQFGTDTRLMAHVREPGIDRGKVCEIAIALYRRMLALPPADAAQVLSAVAAGE